jgi:type I restriction enzyme S subunit
MTPQNETPSLRFKEFKDNWIISVLGSFITPRVEYPKKDANLSLYSLTIENGVTPKSARYERSHLVKSVDNAYKVVHPGDFVSNPMNLRFGAIAKHHGKEKVLVSKYYDVFHVSSGVEADFIEMYFSTHRTLGFYNSLATGTLDEKKRVHFSDFVTFKRMFPSLDEQQKIADYISTIDKRISLLKEKYALLEQYKKGVVQQVFSQEIRFKDENGNEFPKWKQTKFDKVFERVLEKNKENNLNVLTISAQQGLINQQKYFNKSVSAKDVKGYYLLKKGDFAYNKSYSKGYPMGAIKRLNNYDKGVVSTLYICFKSRGDQHDAFWEQYFEAGLLNSEISKIAQEGARNHGLLNVSVVEFFRDIPVHAPIEKEQIRIADYLGALDKKLSLVSQQIEQTKTFKKGLLQQMFV